MSSSRLKISETARAKASINVIGTQSCLLYAFLYSAFFLRQVFLYNAAPASAYFWRALFPLIPAKG